MIGFPTVSDTQIIFDTCLNSQLDAGVLFSWSTSQIVHKQGKVSIGRGFVLCNKDTGIWSNTAVHANTLSVLDLNGKSIPRCLFVHYYEFLRPEGWGGGDQDGINILQLLFSHARSTLSFTIRIDLFGNVCQKINLNITSIMELLQPHHLNFGFNCHQEKTFCQFVPQTRCLPSNQQI